MTSFSILQKSSKYQPGAKGFEPSPMVVRLFEANPTPVQPLIQLLRAPSGDRGYPALQEPVHPVAFSNQQLPPDKMDVYVGPFDLSVNVLPLADSSYPK